MNDIVGDNAQSDPVVKGTFTPELSNMLGTKAAPPDQGSAAKVHRQDGDGVMGPAHPTALLVDDNRDLLHFLERLMADAGWTLLTAENANGVELGVEFLQSAPQMLVIVMTGTILPPEEEALCGEHVFPVLRKPFLASDVMNRIRSRLLPVSGAVRAS